MKQFVLSISIFFFTQFLHGQTSNDTIISKKYIDSLKRKLADEKDRNNFLYWHYRLKSDVIKVDTVFIRSDSADITHYVKSYLDENLIPLMTKSVSNYTKNEVTDYIERYYHDKLQVRYIEYWYAIADDKFDAKLSRKERIEYDNLGRVILHATYLQSARRTITKTFWYDSLGTAHSSTATISGYAVWDE